MIDTKDINSAIATLRAGGIIIYPTDTVWGIGCDATNSLAVTKIFNLKRRNDSKALISLVADEAMLERWVETVPEIVYQLIETAIRPLTIVYDSPTGFAKELLAEDGSAAIRVASDDFCRTLCRSFRKPIVSTSANYAGAPTPGCFNDIAPDLLKQADYVAQTARNSMPSRTPSNIIKVSNNGVIKIIR